MFESGVIITVINVAIFSFSISSLIYFILNRSSNTKKSNNDKEDLLHQIKYLNESLHVSQNQVSERLQNQERNFHKVLEDRFSMINKHLHDSLHQSSTRTQTLMSTLHERLATIDQAQKTISSLSGQVTELQSVLSNKQARGLFGEIQLNDMVRSHLPPDSYEIQAQLEAQNGKTYRVDCLLKIPYPPGPIAIDSKFPLEGYKEYVDGKTEDEKTKGLRKFAQSLTKHIQDISEKYIISGKTSDSAIMFVPSENIFTAVHTHLPQIIEKSHRKKVFIVSPSTFWATLNTIKAIFRDVKIKEQAHIMQQHIHALSDDLERLDGRIIRLQKHFDQANEDIRQIKISSEKITKRANKIRSVDMEEEQSESIEDDSDYPSVEHQKRIA